MKSADNDAWITMSQAITAAEKALRSRGLATSVLRDALADGTIPARASTILKEHGFGSVRSLSKRRIKLHIELYEPHEVATLTIDQKYLHSRLKGSRLTFNWSISRLAWHGPHPNRLITHKTTGELAVPLAQRFVMYDVEFNRLAVEAAIKRKATNQKISDTLSAKPPRRYLAEHDYRELLAMFYELAEKGELGLRYGPFNRYRAKTNLKRAINSSLEKPLGRTTLQNCVATLIEIDNAAHSRQVDQELTKPS